MNLGRGCREPGFEVGGQDGRFAGLYKLGEGREGRRLRWAVLLRVAPG